MTKTFLNSCEHWSEKYVEEMHNFYKLANLDYAKLANALNWTDVVRRIRGKLGTESLEILDVACGSGMFPTALQRVLSEKDKLATINYSLLDPSKFAIDETKRKLSPPFCLSKEFNTRLQDFHCVDEFHISWAIHALYAVPKNELKKSLEKFYFELASFGMVLSGCTFSLRPCTNNSFLFRFRMPSHGRILRYSCGTYKEGISEYFLVRSSSKPEEVANYIGTLVIGS